jgi:hypothetical protein
LHCATLVYDEGNLVLEHVQVSIPIDKGFFKLNPDFLYACLETLEVSFINLYLSELPLNLFNSCFFHQILLVQIVDIILCGTP